MSPISDVNVMNVKDKVEHRDTKYCVCIYTDNDKDIYFLINTQSPEIESRKIYDDFIIKSARYGFLNGKDRYVNCSSVHKLEKERLIEKKGNLDYEDMQKILSKIQNSDRIPEDEKKVLIPMLEKWLKDDDYTKNKLAAVFKYR